MEHTDQSDAAAANAALRTMKSALLIYVTEEQAAAAEFAKVLAEEQAALLAGPVLDELPAIVERKSALIARLSELALQRERCLHALGHGDGRDGIASAIEQDSRLAPIWQDLVRHAGEARSRNVTNGILVRTRLDYNQRALNVLRDACGMAPVAIYGPDGRMPASIR
jgi:flagella synthesis protein FlgN